MKFKVGDEVIVKSEGIAQIIQIDKDSLPYLVKFNDGSSIWCFGDEIEYSQAYLNEQKLKRVLGL